MNGLLISFRMPFPWLAAMLCWIALGSADRAAGQQVRFPDATWDMTPSASRGVKHAALEAAQTYALTGDGAGMVVHHGSVVAQWGDVKKKYDLKSTSKSIGMTAVGLAIADGKVKLSDRAISHHPQFGVPPESNRQTGWREDVTLEHLARQTAGFEKPGGYQPLLFPPGSRWHYSDCGPNWLAECITLAMGQDAESLLFERVFTPLGITTEELHWRKNAYRSDTIEGMKRCEFGSGVHACVDAMARIGYLYLREGRWKGRQLLPAGFCRLVGRTPRREMDLPEQGADHGNASQHYGLLWWNNNDGTLPQVPRDAYWTWGLHDSLIVVIPSLDVVAARAGKSWKRNDGDGHYEVLRPFLANLTAAFSQAAVAGDETARSAAPYPASRHLVNLRWAPKATIERYASGSDNWPLTWAADDHLYTAYGDGWGFEPKVETKLSMGFARVEGGPASPRGVNIRTESGEQTGAGPRGIKASGLLSVGQTLYLLGRNSGNARLAWSGDHAETWQWASWRFRKSFGCPCFLNFGRDYAGARDAFVYIYSHDSDSAYQPADGVVLARVPKSQIRDQSAYTFFSGYDPQGDPVWVTDVERRVPVFSYPGQCYRMSVSFHAPSGRYLMCQTLADSEHPQGPRFEGGFGIYDAPTPWGPWTTLFFTRHWDVGPGETAHLPTKWMSQDGATLHLVFSGNDCFSVRRASLTVAKGAEKQGPTSGSSD